MGTNQYILDEDGNPVLEPDIHKWGTWFENFNNRKLAHDEIDGVTISTVFLGLDHAWGDGPPLLFETMIFGGSHDQYQERYSSKKEALAGHK
jgi:hypothetical protein